MKIIISFVLFFLPLIYAGIGSGTSEPGALPVELSSFSLNSIGDKIILHWTTDTEVNNYGFQIERTSLNSEWETIGFVLGSGNSNSPKEYSFLDAPTGGIQFLYRLKQIDNDGKFNYSGALFVEINGINEFGLNQNYPNPFNPNTTITYSIPISAKVNMAVYDALGQLITTLVNENQEAGNYLVNFNADGLSNGMYFYKLQSNNFVKTNKMLLLK